MNEIKNYIARIESRSVASCKRAISDVWENFLLPDYNSKESFNNHIHVHKNVHYKNCDLDDQHIVTRLTESDAASYQELYNKIISLEEEFYEKYDGITRKVVIENVTMEKWSSVPSIISYEQLGLSDNDNITVLHGKYPFWKNVVRVALRGIGNARLVRCKIMKEEANAEINNIYEEFIQMIFPSYMDVANRLVEEIW